MEDKNKKIIISITGASGSIYALRLIRLLERIPKLEAGIVLSSTAPQVWELEIGELFSSDFPSYDRKDYNAPFASGSAKYEYMVIVPCSMGTLGRIASGISDDLTTRAADVILKERRRLICVIRDTPLNLIHISNMEKITRAGGIIMPAAPSFYSKPQSINELVDTVIHRIVDLLEIDHKSYRWGDE